MKNLKIYKRAMMIIMTGTITLTSTGCNHIINELPIKNEIDTDQLKEINSENFIADGITQKGKESSNKKEEPTYYLTKQTNLKTIPFEKSTTIKKVQPYQKVTLLEDNGSWKLVKSGKKVGYIRKTNIKKIKGKYIEVDISDQRLKIYNKKGKTILKTKIVTGIPTNPERETILGYFEIYNKQRNRVLIGKDYKTLVNYWMPFYKAYGIHDAYWRSEFGGEIYKTNGSHGCINLPKEVAPKVYKKVETGTPVLIHK